MRRRRPIYVESHVKASIDRLWDVTQDPSLHQRWDLRFGEISYEPRIGAEPQRFTTRPPSVRASRWRAPVSRWETGTVRTEPDGRV